jgi:hypothetical protein
MTPHSFEMPGETPDKQHNVTFRKPCVTDECILKYTPEGNFFKKKSKLEYLQTSEVQFIYPKGCCYLQYVFS